MSRSSDITDDTFGRLFDDDIRQQATPTGDQARRIPASNLGTDSRISQSSSDPEVSINTGQTNDREGEFEITSQSLPSSLARSNSFELDLAAAFLEELQQLSILRDPASTTSSMTKVSAEVGGGLISRGQPRGRRQKC